MPSDRASVPCQEDYRRRLLALGFDDVRFAVLDQDTPALQDETAALHDWLAAGQHADMHWLERSAARRLDPQLVLPGARSMVLLGVNYWDHADPASGPENSPEQPAAPTWARYARYEDYHDSIKPGLVAAGRALEEIFGAAAGDYRTYVDTGPVLERAWAARAGIGFVGKNTMLISRRHGNWLLLAAIVTRIAFTPDAPIHRKSATPAVGLLCGKCTRCLDACPTEAFPRPGVLDARRCISYQTIENKGVIPRPLRPGIGERIFGCDICLEVCPWNRFARTGRQLLLSARHDIATLTLGQILELTPEGFAGTFRRTPIKRLTLPRLLRNACVVAGNSGQADHLPVLLHLATDHPSPLVRAHAVWAVFRLGGGDRLAAARTAETDSVVLAEFAEEATPE